MRVLRRAACTVLVVLDPHRLREPMEADDLAGDPLGGVGYAHARIVLKLGANHHGLVPGCAALLGQVGPVDTDAAAAPVGRGVDVVGGQLHQCSSGRTIQVGGRDTPKDAPALLCPNFGEFPFQALQ